MNQQMAEQGLHQEIFKWVESEGSLNESMLSTASSAPQSLESNKIKHLKFPFKFKYTKSDVVFEGRKMKNLKRGKIDQRMYDIAEVLYTGQIGFESLLKKMNKWHKPTILLQNSNDQNRVEMSLREHRVA